MPLALCLALVAAQADFRGQDLFGSEPMRLSLGSIAEGTAAPGGGRIHIRTAGPNGYSAEIKTPLLQTPVRKGDVIYLTYEIRAIRARNESGTGRWMLFLQRGAPPWDGFGNAAGSAGPTWRTFHHGFIADKDYPEKTLEATFHVGDLAQELEIRNLRGLNLGADFDVRRLPITKFSYAGREPNAPWRKRAEQMIERHRKADLTVVVTRNGKPVRNAPVRVQMLRHAYPFGTFTEYHVGKDDPNSRRYVQMLDSRRFSRVTVPIYWSDWGWEAPENRKQYLDTIAWAQSKGIRMKAHCLLWPSHRWSPSRLNGLSDDALRTAIFSAMDERLALLGKVPFENVDVLNELKTEREFADRLGFGLYVDSFRRARKAWPKADLVLNDFSVFEGGNAGSVTTREFEAIAQRLRKEGAPVTLLGWQGHFGEDLTPPTEVWAMLDRFQKSVGLPVEITEYDLNTRDEQTQADYTRDLLTAWFAHPATRGFTIWGFWEGSMWAPNGAMYRKDWSPKPNAKVWDELVTRRWWTDVTLRTDANGRAKVRGFHGDYRIQSAGQTRTTTLGSGEGG